MYIGRAGRRDLSFKHKLLVSVKNPEFDPFENDLRIFLFSF
jgi:hypothetical protein